MPRNEPKKRLRKFLEARARRTAVRRSNGASMQSGGFSGLLVPFLFALFYGLAVAFCLFSPVIFWSHVLAVVVLCLWVAVAFRQDKGYWAYRTHVLFGLVFVAAVVGGSVWPFGRVTGLSMTVVPPPYTHLAAQTFEPEHKELVPTVVEGSVLQCTWEQDDPASVMRFMQKEEPMTDSGDGVAVASMVAPSVTQKETKPLVLFRGLRRLAVWRVAIVPDRAPSITLIEEPEITARKTMRFAYKASDDYGVESVSVRIAPTTSAAGMSMEPVEMLLDTPVGKEIDAARYADLTSLPWTGIPVTIQLVATDGAGHKAWSNSKIVTLPSRTFRNPFARALIEERQKLASQTDTAARDEAANVMAGIARQQGLYHGDPLVMMSLRSGAVRLVLNDSRDTRAAVNAILWQAAVRLEEGEVGKARQELAEAERVLSAGLAHGLAGQQVRPMVLRVRKTMTAYFAAMERERARQPPALQELDWPLATASEMLTPDDLQNRLVAVEDQLASGDNEAARVSLARLQVLIENLRTTSPELTPAQSQMIQQVSVLRMLVKGQKELMDEVAHLGTGKPKTLKEKKASEAAWSRAVAQQQFLNAALRETMTRQGLSLVDSQEGSESMKQALSLLQQKELDKAQTKQAEALLMLEKSLDAISDQMRHSLASRMP